MDYKILLYINSVIVDTWVATFNNSEEVEYYLKEQTVFFCMRYMGKKITLDAFPLSASEAKDSEPPIVNPFTGRKSWL